jgi:exodeoxyribonuclease VII small subunit
MARQSSYSRTRERLEEIVTQIKAKDIPLEKSLDLYEEALRLGSTCAEMIDQTDFSAEELENVSSYFDTTDEAVDEGESKTEDGLVETTDGEAAEEEGASVEAVDESALEAEAEGDGETVWTVTATDERAN